MKSSSQVLTDKWQTNFQKLNEKDLALKKANKLVGRYIKEQFADGYAFYEITKETKTKVGIKVIVNIGDDWVIPYWGQETMIDKNYALNNISVRDSLDKIFGR